MKKSGSDSCLTRRRKKTVTKNNPPSLTGRENLDHATVDNVDTGEENIKPCKICAMIAPTKTYRKITQTKRGNY